MKLSEMLSNRVICLAEARLLGVIISATADCKLKRINQLIVADNEENECYMQMRYLNIGDVYYTLYKTPEYEKKGIDVPFQKDIYNTDGKYLGQLLDVELEGNSIVSLLTTNGERVSAGEVVIAGDMIIVKGNNKIRISKGKKKLIEPSKDILVKEAFNDYNTSITAHNEENVDNKVVQPTVTKRESVEVGNVGKIISSYAFLLGRMVIKKILYNGETLIPVGKIIDTEVVELARDKGKLVELTVSSKEQD